MTEGGGGAPALEHIILIHLCLSLSTTQGLTLLAAVRASWVLRCYVVFRGVLHSLPEFVRHCVATLRMWVTANETSLYHEEGFHLCNNVLNFLQGKPMCPAGVQVPLGVAVQPRAMAVPKAVKWQHMLPDAKTQIENKLNEGWDVVYCNGSRKQTAGLSDAGFAVWFGDCGPHNDE